MALHGNLANGSAEELTARRSSHIASTAHHSRMIDYLGNRNLSLAALTILCFAIVTLTLCLVASNPAVGQWRKQTACYADSIAANPNRPTVSNPAHVTQYGALELEHGWNRMWPEE